jgi:hypothetical protein
MPRHSRRAIRMSDMPALAVRAHGRIGRAPQEKICETKPISRAVSTIRLAKRSQLDAPAVPQLRPGACAERRRVVGYQPERSKKGGGPEP